MEKLEYDKSNPWSIYNYSKNILNHNIKEWKEKHHSSNILEDPTTNVYRKKQKKGKGDLGEEVERYFFNYEPNNSPLPDFPEANLELKVTGLKYSSDKKKYNIKERLVCDMINYKEDYNVDFESSKFYIKCLRMLILFYLYEKNIDFENYRFIKLALWKLPQKDLMIIEHDYNIIINKIASGRAHEISESDTMYLAACRKGSGGIKDLREQPFSNIKAYQRAFSLKPSYMRTILQYIDKFNGLYASNFKEEDIVSQLVTQEELEHDSFYNIIIKRFEHYYGKNYNEIAKDLGVKCSLAKHKYALLANEIISFNHGINFRTEEYDEFRKSGITMKTVRVMYNGTIRESMSFENIDYQEIYENDIWENSRLYEIFTTKFLFVIFKEETEDSHILIKGKEEREFKLNNVFFWTMPQKVLNEAKLYWENIRNNVVKDLISLDSFYKISDHKKFHVRPKGTKENYKDAAINPNGGRADKFCYWLNSEYIKDIIKDYIKEE